MPRRPHSVTVALAALAAGVTLLSASIAAAGRPLPLPPTWTGGEARKQANEPASLPPREAPQHAYGSKITRAQCLTELRHLGVPFKPAPPKRHIWLPVHITGPLHGVAFRLWWNKQPTLVDCQFALGLYHGSKIFAHLGIKEVWYSNTWRQPPRRSWRTMGQHPRGMAMDVHILVLKDGTKLNVEKDWEKYYGGPGRCVGRVKTKKAAIMRRLVCALERANVFRTVLTPDSDLAHYNHFHVGGAPVGVVYGRLRWAGRRLDQPLPGTRGYNGYYYYYSCWKFRRDKTRRRCYNRRRRHFKPVRLSFPKVEKIRSVSVWLTHKRSTKTTGATKQ